MTYCLTYQIKGINSQFRIPINQGDDIGYVSQLIRKEFALIPKLVAKIYGSQLQSSNVISQCVRGQDVVTFDLKTSINNENPKFEQYRQVIITPRYESDTTFIVFSTVNFKSMTSGDKIKISIEADSPEKIQNKIKDMIQKNYHSEIEARKLPSMRILLYLPGGIPFLQGTISDFVESFPDYMPHLYAVLITNPNIKDETLNQTFENICDISNETRKALISPVFDNEEDGLCEMASVLGYIQRNGENVMRMIYSIAKFCPFAPMICGLYNLACLSSPTGRTILQITIPLSVLFIEMSQSMSNRSNLYSNTTKFMTYFMSINISSRVPCTEFIEPFYTIGYENYFNKFIPKQLKNTIKSIVAYDPDFRDQDWIRFALPLLKEEDFQNARNICHSLFVFPTMSLREMHRAALFTGKKGPYLFLAPSVSKDKEKRDTIDYINPLDGKITSGKYEIIAKEMTNPHKKANSNTVSRSAEFEVQNEDQIDPKTVKQFVFVCVDKSGSMSCSYFEGISQFTAAQEFFVAFANHCYTFHTNSLYGSIMFESSIEVRNPLNALVSDFIDKMIKKGERPTGCTAMFEAMERAARIMVEANKDHKYENAIYRILVISDGYDNGYNNDQIANLANYLIDNKVRVDAVIVTNSIEGRLVAIAKATGGVVVVPHSMQEGLELFNKEEFFNVDIREFGPFENKRFTSSEISNMRSNRNNLQINSEIKIKQSLYTNDNQVLIKPKAAVQHYKEEQNALINQGKISSAKVHPAQKRIIQELRKIIHEPDPDLQVYPLKDRIDVWRVLIKGLEGSYYENKWFYLTIEFPVNYPEHYPMIRFVHPPYHPNITDQGRICMDHLDVGYNSDFEIRGLFGEVRMLLLQPNFQDPVDSDRFSLDSDMNSFLNKVKDWNNKNAKDSPDEWKTTWKIEKDDSNLDDDDELGVVSLPPQFLCPLTHKIMKEPVKATTKVYYEKSALERHLSSQSNPLCVVTGQPLPADENKNLPIDMVMKNRIADWVKENNYIEDQDDNDDGEEIAIAEFRKKGSKNNEITFMHNENIKNMPKPEDSSQYSSRVPKRPRPKLSD